MADELSTSQEDEVSVALYEVERALRAASRRLGAVVRTLPD